MAGGRPREWDTDYLMQEIIAWARLPDSLNINAFCCSLRPEIDPEYLRQLIVKDEVFSGVYRIVKAYLAVRREEANSERLLSNQAYASGLRVYDKFAEQQWKEELKFEKGLDKEIQTQDAFGIKEKFDAVLNQLSSLSSNRKIDDNNISNDTKS
jgi:hypothetical protein